MNNIEELKKVALDGISDEMLVGGWTAKGISDYAKSLETKNFDLVAQLEAAQLELIKPLPIGELLHRLEGQTYRKWYDDDELNKWRERAEEAEAALSAANEKLSKPVSLPDDGLEDCINMWPDNWRNDFDTGYNFGIWRCEQNIKAAGFKVEGE